MANKNDVEYRLTDDYVSPVYILRTGNNMQLIIYDSKTDENRAIRYCPNEKSVYVDEQSKHAVVEPIIIEGGYITVPFNKKTLRQFLDVHPDNVANGGYLFEVVDEEAEAKNEISTEELKSDLIQAVKDMEKTPDGVFELETLAAVLKGSVHDVSSLTPAELKRVIYGYIESDPSRFVNESGAITIFDNEDVKRKYIVLRAIKEEIIKISADKRSVMWNDKGNSSLIIGVPRSLNAVDYFADFLESDEGMLVLEELQSRF